MRYVAAINPDASRQEFVTALKLEGLNAQTLTKQFGLSRKFDVESYGVKVTPDGRMIET